MAPESSLTELVSEGMTAQGDSGAVVCYHISGFPNISQSILKTSAQLKTLP